MAKNYIFGLIVLILFSNILFALGINHLTTPAIYDNAGNGFGQTFTATDNFMVGVRLYINDPTRPGNTAVNELIGPADLVLFDLSNTTSPVEVARTRVVAASATASGLVTFYFGLPAATTIGKKYFFGIHTSDLFGIGMRDGSVSTYSGGAEAFQNVSTGQVTEASSGRDLSFEVLAQAVVPEPTNLVLLMVCAFLLAGRMKKAALK